MSSALKQVLSNELVLMSASVRTRNRPNGGSAENPVHHVPAPAPARDNEVALKILCKDLLGLVSHGFCLPSKVIITTFMYVGTARVGMYVILT